MIDLAILRDGRRLPLPMVAPRELELSTGAHGYQDLTAFLPLPDTVAAWLVNQSGLRVLATDGPALLWEGRVEDLTLVNGGVRLTALGDWRALDDDRYTALWSDSSVKRWEWLTSDQTAGTAQDRYQHDTNNRLYLALQKDAIYANNLDFAIWGYRIPHNSTRLITALRFDYLYTMVANWGVGVQTRDSNWAAPVTITSFLTSAGVFSGTIDVTFAGAPSVIIAFYNTTGASYTYTGETGALRLSLTNIRVKTTTGAVTADLIARDIRDRANLLNPGAFDTSNRRIVSPGLDLTDVLYEDASPQDVLADLAELGDGSGGQFETGVWDGRTLHFRPQGSDAARWVADAASIEIAQSLDGLVNSTYAVYEDASDRTRRTADQVNAASISRYGRTRRRDVEAKTTSASLAAQIAATATAATATPVPRAKIDVRRVVSPQGAPVPAPRVRAGDVVSVRNLSPTAGDLVERVRTFRVAETSYSVDDDTAEISPEDPTPDLANQLALVLRKTGAGQ